MGLPQNTIFVSGPVIVENGKVLLIRAKKDMGVSAWQFPGGKKEKSDAF